ncbi:2-methylaconitate cis-trans isomerase PrpF [Ferrimonas balearica]|uniref:2-methylaconitate cis-trans isomerase PrpF n=1 Tax=Ferrimonas balearica TaxID=44012 RepID=UPI001C9872A8|nr:2-methylaconitate cis-trans isomerase PrpF [Ferrimonas balearica]MBY6108491.1 2-methylaconitate cis-trans isomerase PrpF [Ferrimonas balearica]
MSHQPQRRIAATYMRGGTSKGVFFKLTDLPAEAQLPGPQRDAILLRVIGSPDPYGKHTDGMGGATSSTSKTVILSPSERPEHDVDYLFGQVAIDQPVIDWSGNCGNLTAAVGAFAIEQGLVAPERVPDNGFCTVRIWQANIGKTILARVPITDGQVQETGDFELDGVTFPAAEVAVTFTDPADGALFPTGARVDELEVPESLVAGGRLSVTLINAGIPTVFARAEDLGYQGTELQEAINGDPAALARFEQLRAYGALKMGLISDLSEAASRAHTPKIAFVTGPKAYTASSGKAIEASDIDLNVRALSMGKLHHAMMGTAAVAIAVAAAIPGTLVNEAVAGEVSGQVRFGHPSGTLKVGAEVVEQDGQWQARSVTMSRSARVLMEGAVRIPI